MFIERTDDDSQISRRCKQPFHAGFKTQQDRPCLQLAPSLSLVTAATKLSFFFPKFLSHHQSLKISKQPFLLLQRKPGYQMPLPTSLPEGPSSPGCSPFSVQSCAVPVHGLACVLNAESATLQRPCWASPALCSVGFPISSPAACTYTSSLPWVN